MKTNSAVTVITCILPHHQSKALLERLDKEKGIITANKSSARGSSYSTDFKWVEMEVLEVLVPVERSDEIFEFLYHEAALDQPSSGMIYEYVLERATSYALPHI